MKNILTSRDKRFLLVCALVAGVSIWIGVNYFYKAFPEASVEFAVPQDQAKDIALKFLAARGADVGSYHYAGIFGYDDSVKTFLEKDMGLVKANALMGTQLHLWRWANRWFVPLQKEEYQISVTTRGEIARYEHLIPEEREGASLDKISARAKAEMFLTNVMGRDLSSLEFVEDQTQQRPKRIDYTFTWKEKDFSFEDASHRIAVEVDGAEIGAYSDFVHVPEQWMRDFRELRSKNNTASTVDALFMILLVVGMLVVFMQRIRRRDVRRRAAFIFGGITAVLTFLTSLNAFSLIQYNYVTTDSYASFIMKELFSAAAAAVAQGIAIAFFTAAAESLYREFFPDQLAVPNFFRRRTIRTKSFFTGVTLGLTLACFFFAYQTIFYLVANACGAWAPADVPFDNLMNTKLPWLFVLIGGFFPAVSEEFIFRMFAIPFLQRLLKMRWLAIVLAAFIWGFGHAGYPNEPFFIRGLEVGVAGVIIGYIMLRYGILATLVWHYTVDALYSAILMLRSGNAYYMGSGALSAGIMLVPLIICIVAYLKHKSFADEETISNAAEGTAPPLPEAAPAVASGAHRGFNAIPKKIVMIGLVAAAAMCAVLFVPVTKVGDEVDFAITRSDAEHAATFFLQTRGGDPAKWRTVTFTESKMDRHADRYILDHRDVATLNTVYGKTISPVVWRTRYFQSLQKEEWNIDVDPRMGTMVAFEHLIAESDSGATLEKDSAQKIATTFLQQQGIDLNGFVLKESKAEDRKARRDHLFTWEAADGSALNIDEAKYRVEVQVAGNDVAHFKRFMKLPEEWVRQQEESTIFTAVHKSLIGVIIGALILFSLWLFVKKVRAGELEWKPALKLTAVFIAVAALAFLNGINNVFAFYPTTTSVEQFWAVTLIGIAIAGVGMGIGITMLAGLAGAIYPDAFASMRGAAMRARLRDAAIASVIFTGVLLGWHHLAAIVSQLFPGSIESGAMSAPGGVAAIIPAWGIISGAAMQSLPMTAAIGIIFYIALKEIRRMVIIIPAVIVAAIVMFLPDSGTPLNGAVRVVMSCVEVLVMLAMIRWVLRDNIISYLAAFFIFACVDEGIAYATITAPIYKWNGIATLAIVAVTLAVMWMRATKSMQNEFRN